MPCPIPWQLREVRGRDAQRFLDGLASLRIRIFRDFPYLYDGDMAYERRYLATYFASPRSFVALCYSGDTLVGASTAIPLADEDECFRKPFLERGIDPATVCYYGESVLLPEMRGLGIGKAFMRAREAHARSLPGISQAAFCAVMRSDSHPSTPEGYRPLDAFWEREGFQKQPGMTTGLPWKDLNEPALTTKTMQFWTKNLKEAKP